MPSTHSDLFIIGNSRSGKTSLAKRLAGDANFISASGWVRENAPAKTIDQTDEQYIEFLGEWSTRQLRKDPNISARYTLLRMTLNGTLPVRLGKPHQIIEGIRNPRDFSFLYRPDDLVIRLNKVGNDFLSKFEKGIAVIDQQLQWLVDNNLGQEALHLNIQEYECANGCEEPRVYDDCRGEFNACCLKSVEEAVHSWLKWKWK